uniref:BPI2 domain-containing protein n=1 Tax=Steinernema glaseri TaxID=37863 RepID=A0A1I7ZEK9_9BILA
MLVYDEKCMRVSAHKVHCIFPEQTNIVNVVSSGIVSNYTSEQSYLPHIHGIPANLMSKMLRLSAKTTYIVDFTVEQSSGVVHADINVAMYTFRVYV